MQPPEVAGSDGSVSVYLTPFVFFFFVVGIFPLFPLLQPLAHARTHARLVNLNCSMGVLVLGELRTVSDVLVLLVSG